MIIIGLSSGQRLPAEQKLLWMVCSPWRAGPAHGRGRINLGTWDFLQSQLFLQMMRGIAAGFQFDTIRQQHGFPACG